METSSQLPGTTHPLQNLGAKVLQIPGGNASEQKYACGKPRFMGPALQLARLAEQ